MKKVSGKVLAVNSLIIIAVGGTGFWGWTVTHPKVQAAAPIQTSRVLLGEVQSSVAASGKVISPGDVGIAPLVSGILQTLNVKVGDSVSAGEVLAKLDTSQLELAVSQARANVITAKTNILNNQTQLKTYQDALDQAKKNVEDQQMLITLNTPNYQIAIDSAKKNLDDATANATANQKTYQAVVDQAKATLVSAQVTNSNYFNTWSPYGFTLEYCKNLSLYGVNTTTVNDMFTHCQTILANQQAVDNAQATLNSDLQSQQLNTAKDNQNLATLKNAYDQAVQALTLGQQKDQLSLNTFQNAVITAQRNLDNFQATQLVNDSQTSASQLALDIANQNLAIAERNLTSATVSAPVFGVVASISTTVGGNVSTQSTQATATTGATGFIVLTKTSALRAYASFSEADAAKVVVGQKVTYSFDALPNSTATGRVLQMDLLPTTSGGATVYGATMTLDGNVPGLKTGMTLSATVVVGDAQNVLMVPATSVSTRGVQTYVNVVTTDAKGNQIQKRTPVVVGLKGDSFDEIQNGLKAGQRVALSTTTRTSSSSNNFPTGGVPNGFGVLSGSGAGGRGLGVGNGGGGGRG